MVCANGSGIAPGASGRLACATATPNTITMSAKPPSPNSLRRRPRFASNTGKDKMTSSKRTEWSDQTRDQCPAVKADFPKSPERGNHKSASVRSTRRTVCAARRLSRRRSTQVRGNDIPGAADANQLGAPQGENDADQSDDAAKDPDRPFGSAGWLSPVAKKDYVLQLTEHGNLLWLSPPGYGHAWSSGRPSGRATILSQMINDQSFR